MPTGIRRLSLLIFGFAIATCSFAADGVFVRFKMIQPAETNYFVRVGGYIHKVPWYLPKSIVPTGADKNASLRLKSGEFTDWIDLKKMTDGRLHDRMNRSGGVAEFPNVTVDFVSEQEHERRKVVIELATAPNEDAVVRRFEESFAESMTSFLVSPQLKRDADELETATQMTARRLRWAREATGGKRHSPKQLVVQTSFWSPQRPELNLREAEVLHLLGFNVVGNQRPEVRERYDLRVPGHTHGVKLGPAATREEIDASMQKHFVRQKKPLTAGVPFGFSDEVIARPPIGDNQQALAHFHQWLAEQKINPAELGVKSLTDVVPIETPVELKKWLLKNESAARRVFYYTSRFRQLAAVNRLIWNTAAVHKYAKVMESEDASAKLMTSTLVADHPYFAGSGLGMGMTPNPAWGNYPLACDWFELGRRRAVDLIGIEDWMGLQYMYGPNWTWEGFQLMGFQAAIFRSGSRGTLPTIAWITPSDETNLRLKSMSALAQGAKHFFYWTYGPTATSTENYWSDLRGAYEGVAAMTKQLAAAEHIIAPGKTRRTRVALLYSISSDLWQPFGYVHMLARRGTYLSLIHDQYLVDMLSEEDVEAGRLDEYDVLYTVDPCIKQTAMDRIVDWVKRGGHLHASTSAGFRNEFNESVHGLANVLGIVRGGGVNIHPGRYHIRGALNRMKYVDAIAFTDDLEDAAVEMGALGTREKFTAKTATVIGTFADGKPAATVNEFGEGQAEYNGTSPGLTYIKEANFVPAELKEKWPTPIRARLNDAARRSGAYRLVELSHPVVETGVYDADAGTALTLANFTYEPIDELVVSIDVAERPKKVRSVNDGPLQFTVKENKPTRDGRRFKVTCVTELKLTDILLFE